MPDTTTRPWHRALGKLWAPVPWMLEAAIVLELVLRNFTEAGVIAALLVFNAAIGLFQEGKAQVVPGDLVKLSLGAVVATDATIRDGSVLLDQSMLTGESEPVEDGAGAVPYAGALVRRGEATAQVTQTGPRTKFGHTAELVRTARAVSSQQKAVLRVVRNLALFNGVLIIALIGYATFRGLAWSAIIPLVLTAVLAAIPVALPATFTLASAIGARALAKVGVLPIRLSAVDEDASIDGLCSDKTGTLTRNQLSVRTVRAMAGAGEARLLSLASADGGQDSLLDPDDVAGAQWRLASGR